MGIDKIAALRFALDRLGAFALADEDAPEGWKALAGEGGGPFAVRPIEGGLLVMPFASFEAADDLAVHLRLLLGVVLDAHEDARGIRVISHEAASTAAGYDELVSGEAGMWIPKVSPDDERLPRGTGWSFADAARAFSTPGARKRVDAELERKEDDAVAEGVDPLEKAENKFGQIFTAREDRGALRRTLSAAVDHSLDASALGAVLGIRPGDSDLGKEESALGDALKRGLGSNPDVMNALEVTLRKAVDEEIKDVVAGAAGTDAADESSSSEGAG